MVEIPIGGHGPERRSTQVNFAVFELLSVFLYFLHFNIYSDTSDVYNLQVCTEAGALRVPGQRWL